MSQFLFVVPAFVVSCYPFCEFRAFFVCRYFFLSLSPFFSKFCLWDVALSLLFFNMFFTFVCALCVPLRFVSLCSRFFYVLFLFQHPDRR